MAKEDRKQKEYQAILENLLKDPSNKKCADCGAAAPRWASATLGVFICMRCAGLHRNIGVHITFVRSVTLDKWTPEHVQKMQEVGNSRAALMYEAKIPVGYPRPNPTDSVAIEKWIRDKYEKKRFYADVAATPKIPGNSNPVTRTTTNGNGSPFPPSGFISPRESSVPQQLLSPRTPTVSPTPAPPSLLLPQVSPAPQVIPAPQPILQQQQLQQQQIQQLQSHTLQGIKIPTPEEQAATKKANVLQLFEQPQPQPQPQHQHQHLHQHQQQQMLYNHAYAQAYAQAAYLQQQQFGQQQFYDPRFAQQGAYPYGGFAGAPLQFGVPQNSVPQEKRPDSFATLLG